MNKGGLGRGLSSLIPPKQSGQTTQQAQMRASNPDLERVSQSAILDLPVDKITTNDYQPRSFFDPRALQELADSIAEHGLLEPIVVRPDGDGWQLVAGERRLRAHKLLNKKTVQAIVREAGELERLQLALIENIQREDLNPMELAESYNALVDEFGVTQQEAARRLGIARSTFANVIRYLELPAEIQEALGSRRISEGHGKILLGLPTHEEQMQVFRGMMNGGAMSVRELEKVVAIKKAPRAKKARTAADLEIQTLEQDLQERLGTKVHITSKGKGKFTIVVEAYSTEELKGVVKTILSN